MSNNQLSPDKATKAYATLLTRPSYLAGALLLAYTLNKHSHDTPLYILYTPETLPQHAIDALKAEQQRSPGLIPYPVDHLRIPKSEQDDGAHGMVAERFIDTWTKLRVFEVMNVERLCFLDADMMIFNNPSPYIFNEENNQYVDAENGTRLCATHICVCNLDHDAWAPSSWTPHNCAHTHVSSPNGIPEIKNEPDTMGQMNTGTFVFRPSPAIRSFVMDRFNNTPPEDLRRLKFPDQDFLNNVFKGRWKPLSWRTNALKTWRYWHPKMWRDDQVAVLHYIVDKPWAARVTLDASGRMKAGYKGDDGDTHSWWWDTYHRWRDERKAQGETQLLATVSQYVASADGKQSEEMRAVGGGAQDFAKKWEGKGDERSSVLDANDEERNRGGSEDPQRASFGPVLRKPALAERGHGPVVRRGRGL